MAKISSSAKNGLPTHHHPVHSAEYIEVLTAMGVDMPTQGDRPTAILETRKRLRIPSMSSEVVGDDGYLFHLPLKRTGLVVLVAKVLLLEGVRGVGVVVPCVFTLFTLIRYVDVLLWAWNTFVDIAKYQKTAKKTAILKHTNATAKVALCLNRDVIFREFSLASYFCINKRIILILEREQLPVHRDNPNTECRGLRPK